MTIKTMTRRTVAGVLLLAGASSSVAFAAPPPSLESWEIAGQMNPAANPSEVWSYGYKAAADCSGPFVKMTNSVSAPFMGGTFKGWRRGPSATGTASLPQVMQWNGGTAISPLKLSPRGLELHPGPAGECAVVRFTAPDSGRYEVHGRFWAMNNSAGGTNTDTMVVVTQGGTPSTLNSGNVIRPGTPSNNPFHLTGVDLHAGDTVDFMVGAHGNFTSDSTGLHGYIERQVP